MQKNKEEGEGEQRNGEDMEEMKENINLGGIQTQSQSEQRNDCLSK